MKIALIFDMDGVVVDNYRFHERAWKVFCDRHELNFDETFRSGIFGGTNKDHLEAFYGRQLNPSEISRYETEKEAIYRELYVPHIQPLTGLVAFLEHLMDQDIPLALATSSPRVNVDFVLQKTGTSRFFKTRLDASDVLHGKPHPEIYLKAAEAVGQKPSQCIVFEDSVNGIRAAREAGAKVVAVTTTHQKKELPAVDHVIADFEGLTIGQLKNVIYF